MEISHREFRAMANEVDEMHHDSMRTFRQETADLHLDQVKASRRRFLGGLGMAAAAGGVVAVTQGFAPTQYLLPKAFAEGPSDVDIAVFAESVELAAVAAYMKAAGVLSAGTMPVGELFARHHQDHAQAFAALTGGKATGKANAKLVMALTPQLSAIKTEAQALDFAFVLEQQATETYAFALTALTVEPAYKGTATILPIESAHAGVLGSALGKDLKAMFPTDAFITATVGDGSDPTKGLDPAAFPVA
jgi:rubrerythrin